MYNWKELLVSAIVLLALAGCSSENKDFEISGEEKQVLRSMVEIEDKNIKSIEEKISELEDESNRKDIIEAKDIDRLLTMSTPMLKSTSDDQVKQYLLDLNLHPESFIFGLSPDTNLNVEEAKQPIVKAMAYNDVFAVFLNNEISSPKDVAQGSLRYGTPMEDIYADQLSYYKVMKAFYEQYRKVFSEALKGRTYDPGDKYMPPYQGQ